MNVLVACESSGTVREAFRALGHNAWSCDLLPADDGSPYHFKQDALRAICGGFPVADISVEPLWDAFVTGGIAPNGDNIDCINQDGDWDCYPTDSVLPAVEWDLIIAHPPCTYLSSSGLHWNKRIKDRQAKTDQAHDFFMEMVAHCEEVGAKYAIENPIGCMSRLWRKPDQIVQPWMFGHDASKATCLWIHGLPLLEPTQYVEPRMVGGKKRWANQTDSGQNRLPPSKHRWKIRSKTYEGIAKAMAHQWGGA